MTNIAIGRYWEVKVVECVRSSDGSFREAIANLRQRAARARRTRTVIAALLVSTVIGAATLIFQQYAPRMEGSFEALAKSMNINRPYEPDWVFLRKIDSLLDQAFPDRLELVGRKLDSGKEISPPPSREKVKTINNDVDALLVQYSDAQKAYSLNQNKPADGSFEPIVSTLAFSVGAVMFILLGIQISMMFIRYYSQLAEFYDSQALALEVSNGDVDTAVRFFQAFSPTAVALGKSPITIYEKAFETIRDLVKNGRRDGGDSKPGKAEG